MFLVRRAVGPEARRWRTPFLLSRVCRTQRLSFAASPELSDAETTRGLLNQLNQESDETEGRVLSFFGGSIRTALPGAASVGSAVDFGSGNRGVVLRYDKKGATVLPVARSSAERVQIGGHAELRGSMVVRTDRASSSGITFVSVPELLDDQGREEGIVPVGAQSVLRLPMIPPPFRRGPLKKRLASGLAAVEVAAPLGEGHRVGFVGPPGTGKSRALKMLLAQQKDAVVYLAHRPVEQLKAQLGGGDLEAHVTVIHTDNNDTLGARYLAPLCAMHLADSLRKKYRHVLLVVDDIVAFAEAVRDVQGGVPVSITNVMGAMLDAAGCDKDGRALSVVAVVDLAHEEALPSAMKDLWRSIEPSLDVCVSFKEPLIAKGILPAIDVDHLMCGFAPPYQAPFMKILRRELAQALKASAELKYRLDMRTELGLGHEDDEKEDLVSAEASRMLLTHSGFRTLQELAVLICASLVFHFPAYRSGRPPPPSVVAEFQEGVLAAIRDAHPVIWESLASIEELTESDANVLLQHLGRALMSHRHDFAMTRPEL